MTPHTTYKESVEELKGTRLCQYLQVAGFTEEQKDFLKSHTLAILQSVIDGLVKSKKPVIENMVLDDPLFIEKGIDGVKGYNKALQDQIDTLNKEILAIKEM